MPQSHQGVYLQENAVSSPSNSGKKILPRICILGGGFAGLYTALSLARLSGSKSFKPRITLIDKEEHFLFTPFLYELITEEFREWEIAPSFKKLLHQTNILFLQATVENINLEKSQIQLQTKQHLTYDYLVLAVGRKTFSAAVPQTATDTYPFRTLADADRLKQRLQILESSSKPNINIAIIGGGPNGVELAGKIADRLQHRGKIYLIVRSQQILKGFSPFSQKVAIQSLLARGVEIKFQTYIESVDSDYITFVEPERLQRIPIDLVIETTGTQPREWLYHLDCQHNPKGQILTTPTLQLLNYPEVFALGDLADIRNFRGEQIPATAQAASQQASVTAHNLKAMLGGKSLKAFRYRHQGEMLTLGIQKAVVSSPGINLSGLMASWMRIWVYILLRLPTRHHRLHVIRYRLKQGISKLLSNIRHSFKFAKKFR